MEEEHHKSESLIKKIADKIHGHDSSSSSSESDEDDKKKEIKHHHDEEKEKEKEKEKEEIIKHHHEEEEKKEEEEKVIHYDYKKKTKEDVNELKSNVYKLFGRQKPVHKCLGGGRPADILMWKDKKASATVLGVATAIWTFFELFEYHLITLVCHMAIISLAVLFLWSNASTFINKSPPRIPEVQLPESCVREVAMALRIELNRGFSVLRDIASGKDLKMFLAVIAGLWVLSVMGSWFNFLTLTYLCVVLLFTVPMLYDKYEDQVDAYGEKAMIELKKQYAVFDAKVLSQIPKGPLKNRKRD